MSTVNQDGGAWTIKSGALNIRVDSRTLALEMGLDGSQAWTTTSDDGHDLVVLNGESTQEISLASAAHIDVAEYCAGDLHGVRVNIRGFGGIDLSLALIVAADIVTHEAVVRLVPIEDPQDLIEEIHYPRSLELGATGDGALHVIPCMQGALLPPDWPGEITWWWKGLTYTRAVYMPWFGAIRPRAGYLGIQETPYDAGQHLVHPAGGPTSLGPKWFPSMGKIGYARQMRYVLFDDGDHNSLVHRYRDYVDALGNLRTLESKALQNLGVGQLQGTTIAAASTMRHTQPDSYYYNADNIEANHAFTSFADTAAGLKRFAEVYPNDRVVVHLDGWGTRGYDNLHPDILPPCPDAGGWEGFKAVADQCKELGWLFATHDNYSDFYQDAATYSDDLAQQGDAKGDIPKKAWWSGGAQAFLCSKNALGYVRRNFQEILDRGVPLTATYIDVLSIWEMIECYHPDHRMTRKECAEARAEVFAWVRSKGIVLSSEEPTDWSAPYLDFCYWAPLALAEDLFDGLPVGTPAPLFNGVYHDCVVTPWNMSAVGSMTQADAFLYALSFGGIALVNSPDRTGPWGEGELERAKILADVHRQTGFATMERHELVEADGSVRATTFGGGETVEVDFDAKRYRVEGVDGFDDGWKDA